MQETQLPQQTNPSTPLHEILFSWSKRWWGGPETAPGQFVTAVKDEGSLQQQMQHAAIRQLATAMRMNGVEGDDDVMLSSLENLALAGEIEFADYLGRVQNLFGKIFAKLDVALRMKVTALTLPPID